MGNHLLEEHLECLVEDGKLIYLDGKYLFYYVTTAEEVYRWDIGDFCVHSDMGEFILFSDLDVLKDAIREGHFGVVGDGSHLRLLRVALPEELILKDGLADDEIDGVVRLSNEFSIDYVVTVGRMVDLLPV